MLLASAGLAVLVGAVFLTLIFALSTSRDASEAQTKSTDITASAINVEQLVNEIEASLRNYVITGRRTFLRPYRPARRQLPQRLDEFERLTANEPGQNTRARQLRITIQNYIYEHVEPVLVFAGEGSLAAGRAAVQTEGRKRIQEIRRRFTRFHDAEEVRAARRDQSAAEKADRAIVIGVAGLAGSAAFIVVFGLYLARSIARPVRNAAAGAVRFAEGDLDARLEEGGPGEVGELERAFNQMAERLARARVELEAQNAQLRENERLKSELVNTVSHELRTPLASVLGFTTLLLQRELDPEKRRHYLGIIDNQARRLSDLIDDFLDVRRIEEGRFELTEEVLDIGPLLREEAHLYSAQSGKHRVEVDLPTEPLKVRGDPDRLRQVVGNLLSNAIKYSPQGGIVELAAEHDGDAVRVRVRDYGMGIPHGEQTRIFTKFFRGDVAASGIGGTGLGLAVARDIVESHGGRIGFVSSEGEGTTFWLELPEANGEHAAQPGNRAESA